MSFGEAIKACFQKYATFSGRARRSEYWYFYLFTFLVSFVLNCIPLFGFLSSIWWLAQIIPSLAVTVRRFHDIGKSGWNFLLFVIPVVVFSCYLTYFIFISINDLIDAGINFSKSYHISNSSISSYHISYNPVAFAKIIVNNIIANGDLGSLVMLLIILLVFIILWLVWMTRDSQPDENKWGPNPKEVPSKSDSGMNY